MVPQSIYLLDAFVFDLDYRKKNYLDIFRKITMFITHDLKLLKTNVVSSNHNQSNTIVHIDLQVL
jgi:hypothetical protein